MSEVKVNKISPKQTCTTVTLGDSGDDFVVASGVNFKTAAVKDAAGNVIVSRCGSNITIGSCGAAVSLACGATQSGFGRSGSVNWDTTAKTTNFTAVSGNGYFVNTTSGAITVTLPATPSAGDIVAIKDYANTADTNNITIARNGSNIDGTAEDALIANEGGSVTLVYVDATKGWLVTDAAQKSDVAFPQFIVATGGTVTCCGDYKIHTFTGPGTFTVCSVGNPAGSDSLQVLMVAGGGGGGVDNGGGGGGGGAIFTPTAVIPVTATSYPITVGGGGSGASLPQGTAVAGSNTTGLSLTAIGGGYGGIGNPCSSAGQGTNGGSGGGDGAFDGSSTVGGTATQPTQPGNSGTYGNGNTGGQGGNSPYRSSGGGGGAGSGGNKGSPPGGGGPGGAGLDVTSVFGAAPQPFYPTPNGFFAGGGGGGQICLGSAPAEIGGVGGSGGGGPGGGICSGNSPLGKGATGTANSGGGGGGGANFGPSGNGGNGASGIVIIRYKYQ